MWRLSLSNPGDASLAPTATPQLACAWLYVAFSVWAAIRLSPGQYWLFKAMCDEEESMKYLVEFHASIERGNAIDEKGGPAALFAHVAQRFKPEAFYGNPTRRQGILIVDLATETDVAELMYVLTWAGGTEPTFTPIMRPEAFGTALENAKKAPGIGRPW